MIHSTPYTPVIGEAFYNQPTNMFYDWESLSNVYSYVTYYSEWNRIHIYAHIQPGEEHLIKPNQIINSALAMNQVTLNEYFEEVPTIHYYPISADQLERDFMKPTGYVVGFNSKHYDEPLTSYIVAKTRQLNNLPEPQEIRQLSDIIIKPYENIIANQYLRITAEELRVNITNNMKFYNIAKLFQSSLPELKKVSSEMYFSKKYVDLRLLNESDKDDASSKYVSLKRIAAQQGYQIEEAHGIDLSDSKLQVTYDLLLTLLAYNVSDVIILYLIFMLDSYQNVLINREGLIKRFETQFNNRCDVNTTSAKFIEYVIAPYNNDKLVDKPEIEFYFPVQGPTHQHIIDTISQYYHPRQTIEEINAMDQQLTNALQQFEGYGPTNGIPRYRIKYGKLEEDLLERMYLTHEKFPKEVYLMYSYFRGSNSKVEAISNFFDTYPEPPENFVYKKPTKKGSWAHRSGYSSFTVVTVVEGSSMVLSFSIGGVHGEVIDTNEYNKNKHKVDFFNNTLEIIQSCYPDPEELHEAIRNKDVLRITPEMVGPLNNSNTDTLSKDFIAMLKACYTVRKDKTIVYKPFKKSVSPKDYTRVVDIENVLHADVDSLYPSLIILMKLFAKWDAENYTWKDIYEDLRDERVTMKNFAHSVDEEDWTEEHYKAEATQLINKLLLNSASGAADAGYDTNIRVNNSIISMRIIGQLILTDVVYTADKQGAESVSTNTDGVYFTGISLDELRPIIETWKKYYNLGATPEVMNRFVSKDSNNRFEQEKPGQTGKAAGGTIGNFKGPSANKRMSQPSIVDQTLVEYFKTHTDIANKNHVFDKGWVRAYLEQEINTIKNAPVYTPEIRAKMLTFMWSLNPQKSQHFMLRKSYATNALTTFTTPQRVNRLLFVKQGYTLLAYSVAKYGKDPVTEEEQVLTDYLYDNTLIPNNEARYGKISKVTNYDPSWNVTRANKDISEYYNHPLWNNINIEAYIDFIASKFKVWQNDEYTQVKLLKNVAYYYDTYINIA